MYSNRSKSVVYDSKQKSSENIHRQISSILIPILFYFCRRDSPICKIHACTLSRSRLARYTSVNAPEQFIVGISALKLHTKPRSRKKSGKRHLSLVSTYLEIGYNAKVVGRQRCCTRGTEGSPIEGARRASWLTVGHPLGQVCFLFQLLLLPDFSLPSFPSQTAC